MQKFWSLLLVSWLMLVESSYFAKQAIAQEYEGCWMVNLTGAVIDLNGSVCPRSLLIPQLTPLVFSNLQAKPTPDGRVTVSGSVTNRNSQPMPLVLVEYKLMDAQRQEVLYRGMVPLATSGTLQPGESLNFSRILNANRLPQKPLTAITVEISRYL